MKNSWKLPNGNFYSVNKRSIFASAKQKSEVYEG